MENQNVCGSKPDIFDRIMSMGFLKKFEPIYKKNKEMLLYLFFGGLSTLVAIIAFEIPLKMLDLPDLTVFKITINTNVQVANVISWVCAVIFAYVTNRTWVFSEKAHGASAVATECAKFFAGRFFTLVVENILLNLTVQLLGMQELVAKIAVSVVTIILNYIISKLIVFKNKES